MRHIFSLLGAGLLGTVLCGTAVAAASSVGHHEIKVAIVHATAATEVDTTAGVALHLHHVINCLVGPHGKLYDAKAEALSENPCHNLGNGALADASANRDVHAALTRALQDAQHGIAAKTLAAARTDARSTLGALEATQQQAKRR